MIHIFDHMSLVNSNSCLTNKEREIIENVFKKLTDYIKENNLKCHVLFL